MSIEGGNAGRATTFGDSLTPDSLSIEDRSPCGAKASVASDRWPTRWGEISKRLSIPGLPNGESRMVSDTSSAMSSREGEDHRRPYEWLIRYMYKQNTEVCGLELPLKRLNYTINSDRDNTEVGK